MEEVRVEASVDLRLEPPRESAVQSLMERLTLRDDLQRASELQVANRSAVSTLLDLTKYSPIQLGSSEDRLDTFFLSNVMRADLNPSHENPLFSAGEQRPRR